MAFNTGAVWRAGMGTITSEGLQPENSSATIGGKARTLQRKDPIIDRNDLRIRPYRAGARRHSVGINSF